MYDTREVEGMVKVAICDDDESVTRDLEEMLEKYAQEHAILIDIGVFFDGQELIHYMDKNQERYDILFLDIEMKKMNGLDTAMHIREIDRKMTLIYVTSHESYALTAYQVHPFYFLVKPINASEVTQCFAQAYSLFRQDEEYYEYMYNKCDYRVPIGKILYIMSDKRKIQLYMEDGSVLEHYGKLDAIEKKLENTRAEFWRIHKSILVNAKYIFRKSYDHVELIDGQRLSISRDREKELDIKYIRSVTHRRERG